jgi:hypothetical protein
MTQAYCDVATFLFRTRWLYAGSDLSITAISAPSAR